MRSVPGMPEAMVRRSASPISSLVRSSIMAAGYCVTAGQ
jgi:hypothetical protein